MVIDRTKVFDETPSARIDAAAKHVEAAKVVERITGGCINDRYGLMFRSYLHGYDDAMKALQHHELLEENHQLHGKLLDIQMEAQGQGNCD